MYSESDGCMWVDEGGIEYATFVKSGWKPGRGPEGAVADKQTQKQGAAKSTASTGTPSGAGSVPGTSANKLKFSFSD